MPREAHDRDGNGVASAPPGALSPEVFDAALVEQRQDWLAGRRIPVADRLGQTPALAADPDQAAELIYHEFTLRQDLGECPCWEDYLRQFPDHADRLDLLRQADQLFEDTMTPDEPVPPAALDDYEILEELGKGGMGVVYKARQKSLDRTVALKVIRVGETPGAEERQRFHREALALARSQHPNIVQVYEAGETDGQPFLALEFIAGGSLADHLDGNPLPPRTAASLAEVLARAIDHAHRQGVVHRDLKPANVLLQIADCRFEITDFKSDIINLQSAIPKLTDFGLAKRLDAAGNTQTGAVLGTPSYMAPEQAAGRTAAIGPRTDVYGLGAILYELLTGRPPFRAESPLQTLQQVQQTEPAPPRLLNPAVPRDLETVCLKCLAKEPERRYPSAAALADDLRRWLCGEPVQARRIGAVGRAWRWCRRRPGLAGLVAALAVAVLTVVASTTGLWLKAEAARQETEASDAQVQELLGELLQPLREFGPRTSYERTLPAIEVLLRAEAHLDGRLRKSPDDLRVRVALTNLRAMLADLYRLRGQREEMTACLERAHDLWEPLVRQDPRNPEYRDRLAVVYCWQAITAERHGQPSRSIPLLMQALALWQGLADEQPDQAGNWGRLTTAYLFLLSYRDPGPRATEIGEALEKEKGQLERRARADPADTAVRKLLALTCFALGEVHDGKHSPSEAARFWRQAYGYYKTLPAAAPDDPLTRRCLALCCSRLMTNRPSDTYYAEAVAGFEQAGRRLDALAEQARDPDALYLVRLETYCALAVCQWKHGRADQAEKTFRDRVRPLVPRDGGPAASLPQQLDALTALCDTAEALRESDRSASRAIAREAAALADRCVYAPSRDWVLTELIARRALGLAGIRCRQGDAAEALRLAEQGRRLCAALHEAAPAVVAYAQDLAEACYRVAKIHWVLNERDAARVALRESIRIERQLVERAPSVVAYRLTLSRCLEHVIDWMDSWSDRGELVASLREREKLWPDRAEQLRGVAKDYRKLANAIAEGGKPLSPAEEAERRRYLAESERTRQAAERLARGAGR